MVGYMAYYCRTWHCRNLDQFQFWS